MKTSGFFDAFFESGLEESISPFLQPGSRKWGKNIRLKAAVLALFFLMISSCLTLFKTSTDSSSLANIFLLFAYFFAGIPALIAAIEDICKFEINIDVLMTVAAFLSVLIGSGHEGALLLVLFAFSGAMENSVCSKTKGALSSLRQLSPQKACLVQEDGSFIEKSLHEIKPDMLIHVKAGQIVPLDGRVVEGATSINLVHLTGESLPQTCKEGDTIPAGARNLEGAITMRVTHTSSDSTLSRIIDLIIQAQEAKPKLQRWLDKFENRYAISVMALASIFAAIFPLIFSMGYLGPEGSIYRSLAFLIAASPCALIIALPIAYLSALSACARKGILLKGGMVLDALAKCEILACDKTGTITTGKLRCLGVHYFGECEQALELAYSLERSAMHPIAQAITAYALEKGASSLSIQNFIQVPGYGLQGLFDNKEVYIGKAEWILPKVKAQYLPAIHREISLHYQRGETVTLLSYDGHVALFRFQDTIRSGIKKVLHDLKEELGMKIVMLTGDHLASAKSVADAVGISEYYADLKPEDKLAYISKQSSLMMIGDGINDAPALARASVGISMGKFGSETAIDASDIVLLQDNIEVLGWLIKKSKLVARIVKQNMTIALGAILFATLPALFGTIPLWLAVILHEGGTVLVGFNALRLLKTNSSQGNRRVFGAKFFKKSIKCCDSRGNP